MTTSRLVSSLKTRSNDAANNLFGSIAVGRLPISTSKQFIPLDNRGHVIDLTGTNIDANWLGLNSKSMQFWAYNFCSPLAAVIDRLAEADTNGRIGFLNEDLTPRKNYTKNPQLLRIMRLLKKPNPLQTWEEFNSEQVVLCKIYGWCCVFALGPSGMDKSYTKYLWNIDPLFCNPTPNDDYSIYGNTDADIVGGVDRNSPIKEWQITIFGRNYTIPNEDMLLIKDGYIAHRGLPLGLPLSKIAGLDYWVSNICAAMEADNVLLKKKGPLGVFSYDPKPDMAGWTPMTPEMKDDIQADLDRYGLTIGQLQYIVSKVPIKWNSMSFNVQELMTKETVRQGIDGICDRFGYPAELMSGKNATYENRTSAEKFMYQTVVIPFSLRRMSRYDEFFGLEGVNLVLSYNHLPVLQEDIMHAGQARYATSQSLDIDWKNGIITLDEYREATDMEPVGGEDGKLKYNEYITKYPPPAPPVKTTQKIKSNAAPKN